MCAPSGRFPVYLYPLLTGSRGPSLLFCYPCPRRHPWAPIYQVRVVLGCETCRMVAPFSFSHQTSNTCHHHVLVLLGLCKRSNFRLSIAILLAETRACGVARKGVDDSLTAQSFTPVCPRGWAIAGQLRGRVSNARCLWTGDRSEGCVNPGGTLTRTLRAAFPPVSTWAFFICLQEFVLLPHVSFRRKYEKFGISCVY